MSLLVNAWSIELAFCVFTSQDNRKHILSTNSANTIRAGQHAGKDHQKDQVQSTLCMLVQDSL